MSSFFLKVDRTKNNVQKISLGGEINETSDFYKFVFPAAPRIHLNLEKIEAINVHGIKKWKEWFAKTLSKSSIILFNCPPCIVFQMNMVKDFLLPNVKIESFYVPYYNSKSNRKKNILFKRDQEFKGRQVMVPDIVRDDFGEQMEIDVNESLYFTFLFQSR